MEFHGMKNPPIWAIYARPAMLLGASPT